MWRSRRDIEKFDAEKKDLSRRKLDLVEIETSPMHTRIMKEARSCGDRDLPLDVLENLQRYHEERSILCSRETVISRSITLAPVLIATMACRRETRVERRHSDASSYQEDHRAPRLGVFMWRALGELQVPLDRRRGNGPMWQAALRANASGTLEYLMQRRDPT